MSKLTKKQEAERDAAREELRAILKPGDVVRTLVRNVARSGMSRQIDVYTEDMQRITWSVCKAAGYSYSDRWEALTVGGCGMDMGFAVVYSLSRALFPDGFDCIAPDDPYQCPSNDHSNREHNAHHSDGGYALRQRWI